MTAHPSTFNIPKVKKRPGRTKQTRKKDRAPTAMEKWHMSRIWNLGCLVCGQDPQIHHERRGWAARDHQRTVPLCPDHHRARHTIGRAVFKRLHGIDLEAKAAQLWAESMEMWDG